MSDPQNPEVLDYVAPSPAELKARGKRNIGIALALVVFIAVVFLVMVYKIKTMQV